MELNMTTTGVLIIVVSIALTLYETIAFVQKKKEALLSTWLQRIGFKHPMIGIFVGIIIGHVWCYFDSYSVSGTRVQCAECCEMIELQADEHTFEIKTIEVKSNESH